MQRSVLLSLVVAPLPSRPPWRPARGTAPMSTNRAWVESRRHRPVRHPYADDQRLRVPYRCGRRPDRRAHPLQGEANGDKLDVTFVSFKDGGMNNQFGKKIYTANQPLFTLTKQGNAIATTWQGYSKNDVDTAGPPTFRKQAAPR